MRPITETMSHKELLAAVRELATRAVVLETVGAPAVNAAFKGQIAITDAPEVYIAVTVGAGAADWKQVS